MLARLYADHKEKQAVVAADLDRRRREVLDAVPQVSDALVTSVNTSVAEIFANQRLIELKVGQLKVQSQRFTEQTDKWLTSIDSFNLAVKVTRPPATHLPRPPTPRPSHLPGGSSREGVCVCALQFYASFSSRGVQRWCLTHRVLAHSNLATSRCTQAQW